MTNKPTHAMHNNNNDNNGRSLDACDVLVFGGGIVGITSALVMQSLGIPVGIVAAEFPLQSRSASITPEMQICWRSSHVATTYAMASAYPHNLRVRNPERISDDSQTVFKTLFDESTPGIHVYRMYEVFEHCPQSAPLGSRRMQFQEFDGKPAKLKESINPPAREGAAHLWGWTFKTYFADMPEYVPYLWSLFQARGGVWQMMNVSLTSLLKIAAGRPVINCLGLAAPGIFDDSAPAVIMRGRQVVVPGASVITGFDGLPAAYNYTPSPEIFARADGASEYVHFFPRKDGWILGQTREPGSLDHHGQWQGEAVRSPLMIIDGQPIPAPIVQLNEELLKGWVAHDLRDKSLIGREGYRYYRDPQDKGVRLELESIDGTPIIHNYGHGGSGITMSWGCAIEAARILINEVGAQKKPVAERAHTSLNNILGRLIEEMASV